MSGPGHDVASGDVWDVLYEQTKRRADRHATLLSELRSRASIVLTATGLIASLLGGQALRDEHRSLFTVLAFVSVIVGVLSCMAVLRSVRDEAPSVVSTVGALGFLGRCRALVWRRESDPREWQLTIGHDRLLQLAYGADDAELRHRVVLELGPALDRNRATINFRNHWLMTACWSLVAQIILWMGALR